eukprot:TRINITY_DN3417_c0_g2_i1.p2 TRINITY_DN3417_c0_g2~~TRINITY_DN3417_c0_g2_i1.p2  ORF type:complete len:492 (-),score=63.47 TRINITY_DN3417_c0_g2_i1:1740-3215(-)
MVYEKEKEASERVELAEEETQTDKLDQNEQDTQTEFVAEKSREETPLLYKIPDAYEVKEEKPVIKPKKAHSPETKDKEPSITLDKTTPLVKKGKKRAEWSVKDEYEGRKERSPKQKIVKEIEKITLPQEKVESLSATPTATKGSKNTVLKITRKKNGMEKKAVFNKEVERKVVEEPMDKKCGELEKLIKAYIGDSPKVQEIAREIIKLFTGAQMGAVITEVRSPESPQKRQGISGFGSNKRSPRESKATSPTLPKPNPSHPTGPKKSRESNPANNEDWYDHEMVQMEDPTTEFPKKLVAAMNNMTDDLSLLNKNEYGEWLLDITKDSDLVRRIIKNGHFLTLLLRYLYKPGKGRTIPGSLLYDMGTQTEIVHSKESWRKLVGEGVRIIGGRAYMDKFCQTVTLQHVPCGTSTNSKDYVYNEKSQLPSASFTIVKPFAIGKIPPSVRTHPGNYFARIFVEKLGTFSVLFHSIIQKYATLSTLLSFLCLYDNQ